MRVLYCTDTYLPQVNGVSVVTDVSARGLIARGWEVGVVAPRYPRPQLAARPNVVAPAGARAPRVWEISSWPAPRYPDLRMALPDIFTMSRVMRAFQPDLVHCATEFMIGRLGMWAADRAGVPVVTTYHTNFAQYARTYGLGFLVSPLERYLGGFHRRAWKTLTPSSASRNELARLDVLDVDIWGRGVDLSLFSPSRRSADVRTRLGIRSAFTFLHVGRLAPEKGVDVILRAYALLLNRVGDDAVRLVVAGAGPDETRLREMAPRGTVFLGNLDRSRDLPALYASADAFAFSSTTETLGLVVLEAMASGLPVIAAPAGGVADHLRHEENGLAYPPGDAESLARAMYALVTGSDLRRQLAEGALRTARALGWDTELDRLDVMYRSLCTQASMVRELPLRLHLRKL